MADTQSENRFTRSALCLLTIVRLRRWKGTSSPRSRQKRVLIIGMNYAHHGRLSLKGPSKGVEKAKDVLHRSLHFQEAEIISLSDTYPNDRDKPTQANIRERLEEFVVDQEPNTDYTLIYIGHAHQFPARNPSDEEDGLSECMRNTLLHVFECRQFTGIIPCDALEPDSDNYIEEKVIFDYELKEYLVDRLGPGSQLVAIFDTCHSATLLNLRHHKCNRFGRWTSAVRHVGRRYICDSFSRSLIRVPGSRLIPYRFRKVKPQDEWQKLDNQQAPGTCTGFCYERTTSATSRVYCISACKDKETMLEGPDGRSMLLSILLLLERNQTPTLREIMEVAQESASTIFDGAKQYHIEEELKGVQNLSVLKRLIRRTTATQKVKRWNPELSSTIPLDMEMKLELCSPAPCPTTTNSLPLSS